MKHPAANERTNCQLPEPGRGRQFVGRNRCSFVLLLLLSGIWSGSAAQPYTDTVFNAAIKSVEFYNAKKNPSFPIITLGAGEQVELAFDDLRGGSQDYYYTIQHCDADWNPSNISTAEYLKNYTEDKILNYSYSVGTLQKYTHYEVKLPNENVAPSIPGNYILKVYADDDPDKLILLRRMYVLKPKLSITAQVVAPDDNSLRSTSQKINFTINYGSLQVQNPAGELRTYVMQNDRPGTTQMNNQPTYIRGSSLEFSDVNQNIFPGGNEFEHFDTRTLKVTAAHTYRIIHSDTATTVILTADADRSTAAYTFQYDLDGDFYILNEDGTDPRTDADYAHVFFSLQTRRPPSTGTPYIVGRFNDYKLDDASRMHFDPQTGKYIASLFLKQGVYDYTYVWVDSATGKPDDTALEGSHFETENNYQLLVYYRPAGARWEELVGYLKLNTANK